MRRWLLLLCCMAALQAWAQSTALEDSITLAFEQGVSFYLTDNQQGAQQQIKKVIQWAAPEDDRKGRAHRIMALIHSDLGSYRQAATHYQQAIDLLMPLNQPKRLAACQKGLGSINTRLGDYDQAIFLLKNSLYHYKLPPADLEQVRQCYIELADAYSFTSQKDLAIHYYDSARLAEGAHPFNRALASLALGNFLVTNGGDKDIARKRLEEAHEAFEGFQDKEYQFQSLMALGNFYARHYPSRRAAPYYAQAMALSKEAYPTPYRREVAQVSLKQADLAAADRKWTIALRHYQQALFWMLPNQVDSANVYQLPPDSTFYCDNVFIQALIGKANCFKEGRLRDDALAHYRAAICAVDRLRSCQDYESSKLQLVSLQRSALENALSLTAWDDTRIEDAYFFMEKSKAQVLNEMLREVQARYTHLPDSLIDLSRSLARELGYREGQLAVATSDQDDLQHTLDSLRYQQARMRQYLQDHFPAYQRVSTDIAFIPLNEVQDQLKEGQVVIHYFVGDGAAFALAIRREEVRLRRLAYFAENIGLGENIGHFRRLLEEADTEELGNYLNTAHNLYRLLIAPMVNLAKDSALILVPDGPLAGIPFEALLTQAPDHRLLMDPLIQENFWKGQERAGEKGAAYLLFQYQIQYAFSASLWANEHRNIRSSNTFQAYAPAYTATDSFGGRRIPPLRSAGSHAKRVAALFSDASLQGDTHASTVFLAEASQTRYLHLAMHGFTDHEHPLRSALAFSKPPNKPHGLVFAADLYGMPPLSASLVSLLACRSGDGKQVEGEGVLSLGRAFRMAGAEGVVMSLWDADARLGGEVLEKMYAAIAEGLNPTTALQNAKREYLVGASATDAHPSYWANYVLIGNPQMPPNSSLSWWLLVGGVLVVVSSLFMWYKKRL